MTESVNLGKIGVGFGPTEEFFHMLQKIPYLCLENERVSEPRKNGRRFGEIGVIVSRDTEDT